MKQTKTPSLILVGIYFGLAIFLGYRAWIAYGMTPRSTIGNVRLVGNVFFSAVSFVLGVLRLRAWLNRPPT